MSPLACGRCINRDGKPDLVASNFWSATVSILLGKWDGTFRPKVDYPAGSNYAAVVADVNRDGIQDLVNANQFDDTVSVRLGKGNGSFQPRVTLRYG